MKLIYIFAVGVMAFAACSPKTGSTEVAANETQQQPVKAEQVQTLSSQEAKQLLEQQKDVVVIDVRTPEEYAAGHLKNALHFNIYDATFEANLKALDRNKT
ncbi:MAG: rhodanese-like domain-containing protein, partial [Hymenobacteraceae bacterium]|nr:rhodanese-like domain-containing protein [Hymenobacteraceae bacterium]MDX5397621.1 rhodanese-like domain-containing protein [Hymenobacteraceae bacterium]MDX5513701.1 rhodanese-like domain-containing protein [Hymenobacteraceae bacterium]